jgi:hypothetical protein
MYSSNNVRNQQTVSVNSSSYEEDEKNDGIEEKEDNRKKREWTPAKEAAWAKCLEGRKRYMETKRELTAKEAEDKKMKEKIRMEMLKKQIRSEIEAELKADKQQMNAAEENVEDEPGQETKIECEQLSLEKTKNVPKIPKKQVITESSESSEESSDSESEKERRRKRKQAKKREKKRHHKKRKRYYSSSSSDEEENPRESTKLPHHEKSEFVQPPNSYLRRFSFV